MGERTTVGFSPCIQHRPATGKGDMKRLTWAKALIICCFRGGPTEEAAEKLNSRKVLCQGTASAVP
jgi:hypothetical protein